MGATTDEGLGQLPSGADPENISVEGSFRLSPDRRIRRHAEFAVAQQTGRRVQARHFLFLLSKRTDGLPSRLGIVASRKLGGAPVRNRIKRLCREVFRLNPGLFPLGTDVVVIPRSRTHLLSMMDVAADWLNTFGDSGR